MMKVNNINLVKTFLAGQLIGIGAVLISNGVYSIKINNLQRDIFEREVKNENI